MRALAAGELLDRADDVGGLFEVDPLVCAEGEAELAFLFAGVCVRSETQFVGDNG